MHAKHCKIHEPLLHIWCCAFLAIPSSALTMQGSRGIQHNADGATCHRLLFCSGVYQQVLLVHAAGHSQGLQGQLQAHRWDACCCGFLLCQDPHRTCPCCLGCPSLLGCHLLGWGQGQVTEHDHGSQQDSIKHSAVRIQHVDIRLHGVSTRSRLDAQLLGDAQRAEAGLQALRHGADQLGCGTPGAGHASALGRGEGGELDIDAQAALCVWKDGGLACVQALMLGQRVRPLTFTAARPEQDISQSHGPTSSAEPSAGRIRVTLAPANTLVCPKRTRAEPGDAPTAPGPKVTALPFPSVLPSGRTPAFTKVSKKSSGYSFL
eukprot:scaffold1479_cov19-Tisochrysis_lutea.AAC.1